MNHVTKQIRPFVPPNSNLQVDPHVLREPLDVVEAEEKRARETFLLVCKPIR